MIKLKSIKAKLLIAFLTVGLLSVGVFGYLNIQSTRSALEKEIANKLLALGESKEGQVFEYLDFLESRAGSFASDGTIKSNLAEIIANGSKKAVGLLNQYLVLNKMPVDKTITGILVMDTKGLVVAVTDPKQIGEDEAKDDYFINGLAGISSEELAEEEHFGVLESLVGSAPIIDRETGKVLGVIAIFFKTEKLSDVLSGKFQEQKGSLTSKRGYGKTLEVYLVDERKKMLIHPSSNYRGTDEQPYTGIVDSEPVKKCLEHKEEAIGTYRNYRDEEVFGSSMCFVKKGWTLLTEIQTDEAFLPVVQSQRRLEIMMGVFAVLTVLTTVFFADSLAKPIKKLHQATEMITAGNLDYQVEIKTGDEIEQLAGAFNQMTGKLKESYSGLEEKVKQKTEELSQKITEMERTNKLMVGRELKMKELKKEIVELRDKKDSAK